MRLSTILTAYNNEEIILPHIREVMRSSVLPDEIIVVNDGGKDFLEELKKIDRKCPITYAKINEDIVWNYNGACNLGVWLSRGDFLAFEDADNIPHIDCYKSALDNFEIFPAVGRIIGKIRWCIEKTDLDKPQEEWKVVNSIGANQGSYVIRRELYLDLKGQDERFCGRYGWCYYSWRRQLLCKAKTKFAQGGIYYYVQEAQCAGSHKPDPANYKFLLENTKMTTMQPSGGILNFTYTIERL